ncbi:hypothetical protein NDI54_16625 [Haloarcula sp. S1AR25-5A]|uniref:Uncharacterized protein n=1 Tax=Haloarcula terrestris TaxID=2950533 RepID=A0AAE4EZS3_9EURY|nr:hypothetical protein [Haloarcula terrestris]MDS0222972.1 hypothetical protein [Haloarcula terrestris]
MSEHRERTSSSEDQRSSGVRTSERSERVRIRWRIRQRCSTMSSEPRSGSETRAGDTRERPQLATSELALGVVDDG